MKRKIKFKIWDSIANTMYESFELKNFTGGMAEHYIYLQYTGLNDKNGKEIYEGDIIKTDKKIFCEVIWSFTKMGYCVRYVNKWDLRRKVPGKEFKFYQYKNLTWAAERGNVIGNIFENKELLGV